MHANTAYHHREHTRVTCKHTYGALRPMKTSEPPSLMCSFPIIFQLSQICLPSSENILTLFSWTTKQHSAVRTFGTAEHAFVYMYVCLPSWGTLGNCKAWLTLPFLGTSWVISQSPLWSVKNMNSQSQFLNLESHF